jgi:Site-specific recombinase XerD
MGIVKKGQNLYRIDTHVLRQGREYRQRETFPGTRAKAEERYLQLKKELRDGGNAGCSLTIAETFDEVLSIYREKRNKVLAPDISRCNMLSVDLGKVTIKAFGDRFEAYMRLFKNNPTKKTGTPPANATVNRIIETVRAAFNLAVALGLVKENPITKARFPKAKESPRDRYLTDEERRRFLNAIEAKAAYLLPFVRYSLLVPCRKGELTNLSREAYNAFTNTIYIPKSKAGIPIHKPVPDEMKEYFLNGIPTGCPLLFFRQNKDGSFHSLGDFRRAFKSCLKAAGLQNVRVHDLRHVAASDLCAAGNSERAIMDIAGWKTPMLSTYWHKDSLKSAQNIQFSRNPGHFMDTSKAEAI